MYASAVYRKYLCKNCDCTHRWYSEDIVDPTCVFCTRFLLQPLKEGCSNYEPRGNLELLEYLYDKSHSTI